MLALRKKFYLSLIICFALIVFARPFSAGAAVPVWGYVVQKVYPHDSKAFTQGLIYLDGDIIESTGLTGASEIRRVRLQDGVILKSQRLPVDVFGEGIVDWGNRLYSLTWRDQIGYIWDLNSLRQISRFRYAGEGWGLTRNTTNLIMSDGSATLKFLDPQTLKIMRRLTVTTDGRPLTNLNELEWVKGEIFANVWLTNKIVRIDPATGYVRGRIDLTGLPELSMPRNGDAVLNGIAYDPVHDRLFITGKMWPHIYQITLIGPKATKP